MNDLIEFLFPFRNATKALEGDLTPTIHHVYLWYRKLTECFRAFSDDSPLKSFLKRRGMKVISEKFKISSLHRFALFLNPKFKSMVAFTKEEQSAVMAFGKGLLELIPLGHEVDPSSVNDHSYDNIVKKKKFGDIDDEFLPGKVKRKFQFMMMKFPRTLKPLFTMYLPINFNDLWDLTF